MDNLSAHKVEGSTIRRCHTIKTIDGRTRYDKFDVTLLGFGHIAGTVKWHH